MSGRCWLRLPFDSAFGRLRVSGKRRIALSEGALDVDGALKRPPRRLERQHEAVALALHLEAAVRIHLLPHDGVVPPQDLQPLLVAEAFVDGGRSLDVAEHYGDGAV